MRDRGQNGEGRIGLLIALVLFGSGIFAAVKFVPVKIAAYEFREELREQARYAAVRADNETVAKALMDKAAELSIPLKRDELKVRRTETEVVITAHYVQPVDFKLTTYRYKFQAEERAPLF